MNTSDSLDAAASIGPAPARHRVLIVGGGAGGLELATRLARTLKGGAIEVVLVDASLTHVWKPLLHEVAAGSLDTGNNELDYLAHARHHGFAYQLGAMEGLDRQAQTVWLAPLHDDEGQLIAPRRGVHYDTLVLALGSQVNDFNTPGVREHALALNTVADARRLHKRVFAACLRANNMGQAEEVDLAIIGGGATGVELASELRDALNEYSRYAEPALSCRAHVVLIEAGPDILTNLPQDVRANVKQTLQDQSVKVFTNERVSEVTDKGVKTVSGKFIPAELVVWAAGVKAPDLLRDLGGLESNKLNQLVVDPCLRTTRDNRIFAFGDCSACVLPGRDKPLPPLAQVAHQQARYLAQILPKHIRGRQRLPVFAFKDHGSLISLGPEKAVGTLIGALTGRRFVVKGTVARLSYWALYRGYLSALHGWLRMALTTIGDWLTHTTKTRVKLH